MKNVTFIMLVTGMICCAGAGILEVVFMGISGEGAPAIEKTFELQLQKRLSTQTSFRLADCIVAQHYAQLIKFDDYSMVSRKLVEAVESVASDSTLFVWGTIKKCSVNMVRKNLFRTVIKGEIELNLNVYSLDTKEYSYSGVIKAEIIKPGEFAFLSDENATSHIDAVKRQEILQQCIDQAVNKTAAMIVDLATKNDVSARVVQPKEEVNAMPSIYDVFTVPSVKARAIDEQPEPADSKAGSPK
jgi:hemoglobin-like flavoprotein